MKNNAKGKNMLHQKIKQSIIILASLFLGLLSTSLPVLALGQYGMSPMYQVITLTPGETFYGNFDLINPDDSTSDFEFTVRVEPFSVDEQNELNFTSNGDYNQIVDWITLYTENGVISPNETKEIRFSINVPENAAAGGQYASIIVSSRQYRVENSSVDLREVYEASHLIYAEVAGESIRRGSINDINVPSFLLSGNISGSSKIRNDGNVHSMAVHTMQIFPLFSNEEVFTNEEKPKEVWIMPGVTAMSSISWEETPNIGIFHVIYHVEYEGVESKVDKIVIVCPLWLLFLILLAIFLIIFRILSVKKKKQ